MEAFIFMKGSADMSTIESASQIANSQAVWSILCILLAAYVLWTSNKRETRLLETLQEQTATLKQISDNMQSMEGRMDRMEKIIYKNNKE